MAQVLINEETLSALGDVIREKKGVEKYVPLTYNLMEQEEILVLPDYTPSDTATYKYVKITGLNPNEVNYTLRFSIPTAASSYNYQIEAARVKFSNTYYRSIKNFDGGTVEGSKQYYTADITDTLKLLMGVQQIDGEEDNWYFKFSRNAGNGAVFELISDTMVLDENNVFTPSEMVQEFAAQQIIPDSVCLLSGNTSYRFAYNGWNWFISDKITTADISDATNMFYYSNQLYQIPFDLNLQTDCKIDYIFNNCKNLQRPPYINGAPASMGFIFQGCTNLAEISEEWVQHIDFSRLHSTKGLSCHYVFQSCPSLRTIPQGLIKNLWSGSTSSSSSYTQYYNMYFGCYCLEKLENIPVITHKNLTSNVFANFVTSCGRLQKLTFEINDDGTPIVARWKTQTIDLSYYVGYAFLDSYITGHNSGLTTNTRIIDDASYQELKDNPDAWTTLADYSRYNHDSAVETINSLPDTSAYGTNTIKFKGAAGAKTDGGAINTLTPEEIAVATVKGWTVSLV